MKNRLAKRLFLLLLSLAAILALSGCASPHTRREAAEWFRKNIADETVAVSKEYTERENEEGYTERVWTAHLKDLPEVEFELVSTGYYSLFFSYKMETDYDLVMGEYYLDRFLEEYPDALDRFEALPDRYMEELTVCAVYDNPSEIQSLCYDIQRLDDYMASQEHPCRITYALSYREPLTLPEIFPAAEEILLSDVPLPETYVYETGGSTNNTGYAEKEKDNGSDPYGPEPSVSEQLRSAAENKFAQYALTYRVCMDLCTDGALKNAARQKGDYRFTLTRPDRPDVCYPELILSTSDSMSFGCLYEVLLREGCYNVQGTPEEFSFTGADGTAYSFSYSYRTKPRQSAYGDYLSEYYYYCSGDDHIQLEERPIVGQELFTQLTGCGFSWIDG